jgi:galactoside O-acetyltransferase
MYVDRYCFAGEPKSFSKVVAAEAGDLRLSRVQQLSGASQPQSVTRSTIFISVTIHCMPRERFFTPHLVLRVRIGAISTGEMLGRRMHNPFNPGYYHSLELRGFGFARVGENTAVARNCTIVGLENITIGDNVRIDGYSTIIAPKGRVRIGNHVHIASGCALGARAGIEIDDYCSFSQGVRIFSAIDDFSGRGMTSGTLPAEYVRIHAAPVSLGRHVAIGSGTLVLPGVAIGEGAAVGALSLVNQPLAEWTMHAGNPAKPIGPRSRDLLRLEQQFQASRESF